MTGLIDFSTDAASNDAGAPPILWVEGQPANTINNSMREVMAALARWHADVQGGLGASGGGANAYSVATNQVLKPSSLDRAFSIAFQPDALNTGPCTLNLDGIGARSIRRPGNIEMAPGDLQPGIPYRATWLPNLGVYTIASPHVLRPGKVEAFGTESAVPPGWVLCDGRALSRSAYAALFFFLGGAFGTPDGNTFRVPDLNGRAIFGVDRGAGRLTGAGGLGGSLGNGGGSETVTLTEAQLASHGHGGSTGSAGAHDHGGSVSDAGQHSHGGGTGNAGGHSHTGTTDGNGAHTHTGSTDAAGEHGHNILYTKVSAYGAGGNPGVPDIGRLSDLGNTNTQTDNAGSHAHNVTVNGVSDHQHGFTTSGAADHAHSINADGQHHHTITGVADHAHSLAISPAGGGQAHGNVPPGLVLIYAIKA